MKINKKVNLNIQVGGWAFVCPCVQKIQRLSLNLMTLQVSHSSILNIYYLSNDVKKLSYVAELLPLPLCHINFMLFYSNEISGADPCIFLPDPEQKKRIWIRRLLNS